VNVAAHPDVAVARIAAAIGEPARARMLYCLMDGRARTSTELAMVAAVSPSTASVHLQLLREQRLVSVLAQGKHRYYSVSSSSVASALEGLSVLAGRGDVFEPSTPERLRAARTCYDHLAGTVAVALHDRFKTLGWLSGSVASGRGYALTPSGSKAFGDLGVDVEKVRSLRRRFACPCLDWSERRPHLAGALGAAVLKLALKKKWLVQHLDSRALDVTALGRREMVARFGIRVEAASH